MNKYKIDAWLLTTVSFFLIGQPVLAETLEQMIKKAEKIVEASQQKKTYPMVQPIEVKAEEVQEALADIIYSDKDTGTLKANTSEKPTDLSIWKTERFQKAFLGSYGVNAEIEPRVSIVEQEQMQKVLDVMAKDESMEKAIRLLERYNNEAASAIFDFTIGNLYFQGEELDLAIQFYDQAIEKFPNFRRAYKNAGLIHVRQGEYHKAIPYLTKTIELGAHTSLAYGLLGYAYGSTEQHMSAESAYRMAIMLDPATVDWQMGLARSFFKQQKYADAASLCATLIEKNPQSGDFWLLQANAYLGLKQPMRAAENYEYVNLLGQATTESMTMLADIYINEARWDLAANAYLRAYEMDRDEVSARPLRAAKILAARGALDQAKRILNRVAEKKISLSEDDLKELLKLQARVLVSEGAGAEVVSVLEEVVSVDPLDGEALMLLAQHYGRERPEKAVFYYERAANVEKYEAEAKLRHGQLLVGQSKYQEAIPFLRRAYELNPRSDVEDYLRQVERIAKSRQ